MLFKRSLLQELFSTALAAMLVLVGIIFAQRVAYFLNLAARGSVPGDAITTLLGFGLLKALPLLLSLTIFLSVLLTLTRWHRDSEMAVWFSSGLGLSAWLRPISLFAVPVVVVIALLNLFVTPWASDKAVKFMDVLESRDELAAIAPGTFKESEHADRVFFVESFDKLGKTVKNVFFQSLQHQKLGVVVAQQGYRSTAANGDSFLVMENGRRYEGERDTPEFTVTQFERYDIRIEPREIKNSPPTIRTTASVELVREHSNRSSSELQGRLAMPISAFLMVILAIPLSFVDPRAGRSANMIMALLIYVIYNNLLSILQVWVAQGKLNSMIGLWPAHGVVFVLTVYLFYRRYYMMPLLPQWVRR